MRVYTYTPELRLLSYTKDDTNWTATHTDRNTKFDVVWFGDRPVAEIRPDLRTIPFYTYTDHLDTPYMQTDTAGNVLWMAEYEPYGNLWTMRVAPYDTQLLRFPGQEVETTWEGTEERYNIFRWYRSGWGRYTQVDPAQPAYPSTAHNERPEISSKIESYGYAGNAHRHAPGGWMPAMKYLVEELHMDVNARDQLGMTPLHHAAKRGEDQMILLLLKRGAIIDSIDSAGKTPLQ